MQLYTVMLSVPNWLTPRDEACFTDHVTVDTSRMVNPTDAAREAVGIARHDAMDAYNAWDDGHPKEDFRVVAVFPGHLDDCNPEF